MSSKSVDINNATILRRPDGSLIVRFEIANSLQPFAYEIPFGHVSSEVQENLVLATSFTVCSHPLPDYFFEYVEAVKYDVAQFPPDVQLRFKLSREQPKVRAFRKALQTLIDLKNREQSLFSFEQDPHDNRTWTLSAASLDDMNGFFEILNSHETQTYFFNRTRDSKVKSTGSNVFVLGAGLNLDETPKPA